MPHPPHGPPDKGPLGPRHHGPLHGLPHERRGKLAHRLFVSIGVGTLAAVIAALVMWSFQINIATILPVIAPIWVGIMALTYNVFSDK